MVHTVSASELGTRIISSELIVADELRDTFCTLYFYKPQYIRGSYLELRFDFQAICRTNPSLATAALRPAEVAPAEQPHYAGLSTVLTHLKARLLDQVEVDLFAAFDGENAQTALERLRHAWNGLPRSEVPPPQSLLRRILYRDVSDVLLELPAVEHAH